MQRTGLLATVVALGGVAGLTAPAAEASVPGRNGLIAWALSGNDCDGDHTAASASSSWSAATNDVPAPDRPAWTSDGRHLAFASAGRIAVVDARGFDRREIFAGPVDRGSWLSPDGRRIA